jgi:hypothetical protein
LADETAKRRRAKALWRDEQHSNIALNSYER